MTLPLPDLERERLAAVPRAVELGAVRQPAGVVDGHRLMRLRLRGRCRAGRSRTATRTGWSGGSPAWRTCPARLPPAAGHGGGGLLLRRGGGVSDGAVLLLRLPRAGHEGEGEGGGEESPGSSRFLLEGSVRRPGAGFYDETGRRRRAKDLEVPGERPPPWAQGSNVTIISSSSSAIRLCNRAPGTESPFLSATPRALKPGVSWRNQCDGSTLLRSSCC